MTSCQPTEVEQFAIEAKLNLILGAEAYDRVFHGLDCPDRAERAGYRRVRILVRRMRYDKCE